jgi:hypothetical protein
MKVPCEFCGNEEYDRLHKYVDGKPFCTSTCVTLWRERQGEAPARNANGYDLDALNRAVQAAGQVH